jgi:spermidine/putrescine transport system ATP-binding protein
VAKAVGERPGAATAPPADDVVLSGVSKRFGEVVAVDDVSLRVRKGEFLCLLGPSGCGKSTTLRMIAGFEVPDAGTIAVGGADVTYLPPERRDCNMVFQHYALFPHMTVFQNVGFGLRMERRSQREIAERVERVLGLVEMRGLEHRKPHQLSGGQQQRVALARAVVKQPTVLLLDEPLGALDLRLRKQMQVELKGLQHTLGITFIFVTHDQDEAMSIADRIAVMRSGRIEQLGTPLEIYENPVSRYVCEFVGASNLIEATVVELREGTALLRARNGIELAAPAVADLRPGAEVLVAVRPEKIALAEQPSAELTNHVRAEVVDVSYQGTHTIYLARLETGETLQALRQNITLEGMREAYSAGHSVFLNWRPAATKILTR